MNELSPPHATTPSAAARAGAIERLQQLLLGPDEDAFLPVFQPHTPCFNLLPKKRTPSWLVLGAVSTGICVLLLGMTAWGLTWLTRQTDRDLQEVQRLASDRKLQMQRYQQLQRQVEAIEGQTSAYAFVTQGSPHWAEILDRLRALLPGGVHFSEVEGDSSGTLLIRGTADSLRSVGRFMLNLRGSGYFYEPRLGMGDRQEDSAMVQYDLSVQVAHVDWLMASPSTTASGGTAILLPAQGSAPVASP